jgi:hypothetical protein
LQKNYLIYKKAILTYPLCSARLILNFLPFPPTYVFRPTDPLFCSQGGEDDDDEPLLQQLSRQEELRQEKQRQMEDYVKQKLNESANKNSGKNLKSVQNLTVLTYNGAMTL